MTQPGFDAFASTEDERFYWDTGDSCKIRVVRDEFNEASRPPSAGPTPKHLEAPTPAEKKGEKPMDDATKAELKDLDNAPYKIYVRVNVGARAGHCSGHCDPGLARARIEHGAHTPPVHDAGSRPRSDGAVAAGGGR